MNGILTSGSNNNNGWLGGSDAAAEVKRYLLFTIVLHYCSNQGTWTWPDGSSFSWTNWWTGECWLLVGISSCCDTGGGGQPAGGDVQNCLQMRWKDAMWDDVSCNGAKEYFVCKK